MQAHLGRSLRKENSSFTVNRFLISISKRSLYFNLLPRKANVFYAVVYILSTLVGSVLHEAFTVAKYTAKIDLSGTKDYKMREVTTFRGLEGTILTRFFKADCNQEKLEFTSATAVDEVFGDLYVFNIPVLIPAADCSYWGI